MYSFKKKFKKIYGYPECAINVDCPVGYTRRELQQIAEECGIKLYSIDLDGYKEWKNSDDLCEEIFEVGAVPIFPNENNEELEEERKYVLAPFLDLKSKVDPLFKLILEFGDKSQINDLGQISDRINRIIEAIREKTVFTDFQYYDDELGDLVPKFEKFQLIGFQDSFERQFYFDIKDRLEDLYNYVILGYEQAYNGNQPAKITNFKNMVRALDSDLSRVKNSLSYSKNVRKPVNYDKKTQIGLLEDIEFRIIMLEKQEEELLEYQNQYLKIVPKLQTLRDRVVLLKQQEAREYGLGPFYERYDAVFRELDRYRVPDNLAEVDQYIKDKTRDINQIEREARAAPPERHRPPPPPRVPRWQIPAQPQVNWIAQGRQGRRIDLTPAKPDPANNDQEYKKTIEIYNRILEQAKTHNQQNRLDQFLKLLAGFKDIIENKHNYQTMFEILFKESESKAIEWLIELLLKSGFACHPYDQQFKAKDYIKGTFNSIYPAFAQVNAVLDEFPPNIIVPLGIAIVQKNNGVCLENAVRAFEEGASAYQMITSQFEPESPKLQNIGNFATDFRSNQCLYCQQKYNNNQDRSRCLRTRLTSDILKEYLMSKLKDKETKDGVITEQDIDQIISTTYEFLLHCDGLFEYVD